MQTQKIINDSHLEHTYLAYFSIIGNIYQVLFGNDNFEKSFKNHGKSLEKAWNSVLMIL